MKAKTFLILLLTTLLFTLTFCSKSEEPEVLTNDEIIAWQEKLKTIEADPVSEDEIGIIETKFGTIKFEFFTDVAPNHCANFKKLANSGFYDWVTFHRVMPNFMIQGGDINSKNADPNDDGMGSPGYTVDAEFSDIPHTKGIVSTARKGNNINSASSQFFIMHAAEYPSLDGNYTVFGKVIEGLDIVDSIAAVPTSGRQGNNRPLENIYMKKVRVEKK
ncbi:peptidylprolyl isomerase [candidate division KSB1 bacterium]